MDQKLKLLYNTLALIETKGENTKLMAQCLTYLDRLIKEEQVCQCECHKEEGD